MNKVCFNLTAVLQLGPPVIDVSVKRDSFRVDLLKFFGILAGRCGSVVVRDRGFERSEFSLGWTLGFDCLSF